MLLEGDNPGADMVVNYVYRYISIGYHASVLLGKKKRQRGGETDVLSIFVWLERVFLGSIPQSS